MTVRERLLQYGTTSALATKAEAAGLSATKIRTLSQKDLSSKFGLDPREAADLKKCIKRHPIEADIVQLLLEKSNHLCCICKGSKGSGVILHHIVEYERSQDNSYGNLAVLCPNDHDRAHQSGLTLGLTAEQIRNAKNRWEKQVEISNAQKAAKSIKIRNEAVDYVNVMRIEEMCVQLFGEIPATTISPTLQRAKILGPDLHFDEKFVRKNLSNGGYLFDYISSRETEHYRQLLVNISTQISFSDLSEAARSGIRKLKALEGKYTFFIGGVTSKRPDRPITSSQPLEWLHKTTKLEIIWHGDAKYLMSSSAISRQGTKNRYILYGAVRTVEKIGKGPVRVTCSPLFVAQPIAYVDRTPSIAWKRRYSIFSDGDMDENAASAADD